MPPPGGNQVAALAPWREGDSISARWPRPAAHCPIDHAIGVPAVCAPLRSQKPVPVTIDVGDRLTGSRPPPPPLLMWLRRTLAMDTDRFDQLARTLGTTASRRGALAGVSGGLLAAVSRVLG